MQELNFEIWHWLIIALVFISIEIFAASGIFLGSIISASIICILKIFLTLNWQIEITIFALASLIFTFLITRYYKKAQILEKSDLNDKLASLVGVEIDLLADIDGRGKVQIADTLWDAEGENLKSGMKVIVKSHDKGILHLERSTKMK